MATPTTYKPSPLGYGSSPSRSSPFRRPESPSSPLAPRTMTTPTGSPSKSGLPAVTSRFARLGSPISPHPSLTARQGPTTITDSPPSLTPSKSPAQDTPLPTPAAPRRSLGNGNALSKLLPAQVRSLRDGFQILDRDCDGVVNGEDVADMLSQLGLPNGPSEVANFFPGQRQQTIALAAFLNSLAEVLAALSPSPELLSALSAFDDDDSGQVDCAELRDAVLSTAPERGERALTAGEVDKVMSGFTGRRAFNRNMNAQLGAKKGETFKYAEFVGSIMGSGVGSDEVAASASPDE